MAQQAFFEIERGQSASDDDAYREAMNAAGRILARRPHSTAEMRTKLEASHPGVADAVIERLAELDLLDDLAFARQWVTERCGKKGRAALLAELDAKGISREVAETALESVAGKELAAATDLAAKQLRRVAHKPLVAQGASIHQSLLRRGFPPEVAEEATRAVMPPEGWD